MQQRIIRKQKLCRFQPQEGFIKVLRRFSGGRGVSGAGGYRRNRRVGGRGGGGKSRFLFVSGVPELHRKLREACGKHANYFSSKSPFMVLSSEKDLQIDRQKERRTDRQTGRHRHRQIDRQTFLAETCLDIWF